MEREGAEDGRDEEKEVVGSIEGEEREVWLIIVKGDFNLEEIVLSVG